VAAVVSHLLRRESETGGELALPTGSGGLIQILTNGVCPDVLDTCAQDPVTIQTDTGPCTPPNPEGCGDDRWKFVTAHEIGHVVQRRNTGRFFYQYKFDSELDHPGAPPECRCDHVAGANAWHCLQSLELPGAVQTEGFAQYFASKAWNDLGETDCGFPYYKDFLDTMCLPGVLSCDPDPASGLIINRPPVPVSCIEPIRWRNNHCLETPVQPGEVIADLGVEFDWMGFYYKLTNPGTSDRLTPGELHAVYRSACGGGCSFDEHVAWADCTACTPVEHGIAQTVEALQAQGHLSAAQRDQFLSSGDQYGVSQSTAP